MNQENSSLPFENLHLWFLSSAKKRKALAALVLGGSVLILFAQVLFSENTLVSIADGDLANQFYAWRDFGFSELRKGHLALWNPFIYCGAPFFAGFQSALLYPPNWLFLFLPLVFALNFSIVLHVFLAGFFTYLWLAANRLGFLASLFGSFVYMFGGAYFLHVYPGHLPNLCTMAWIPLVFLSVETLLEKPELKNVLISAGVFSFQLLSGHAQYFAYTLFLSGLYALLLLFRNPENRFKKVFHGLAMLLMGSAITSIQWLSGLEATGENLRESAASPEFQRFFSLNPLNSLTVLASGLGGKGTRLFCWADSRIWWESCLFIGIIAFLMAIYGLIQREGPQGKKWTLMGLALLSLLLAFGSYTPLFPLLNEWIPFFDSFRGSFKFGIFFQLAFAFLAARGIHAWLFDSRQKNWPAYSAFGLALIFGGASFLVFQGSRLGSFSAIVAWNNSEPFSPQYPQYLLQIDTARIINLAGASVFSLIFALLWIWTSVGKARKYALAILGMANLWAFAGANLPTFNAQGMKSRESAVQKTLSPHLGEGRIYWTAHDDRSLSMGLPDIWGDDPLLPKRYNYFMTYTGNPLPEPSSSPDTQKINLTLPKIRLVRLAYMLDTKSDGLHITSLPYPRLPRAFLVGRWKFAGDPKEAMETISRSGFDPGAEVVLEKTPAILPEENSGKGQVSLEDQTTDRMEFHVQTDKPQILMITDNFSRGWKAIAYPNSVQQTYEVMPGDYFGRAIPLSAGNHHFILKFEPAAFEIGKWISSVSLLLYLFAWLWQGWGNDRFLNRPRPQGAQGG